MPMFTYPDANVPATTREILELGLPCVQTFTFLAQTSYSNNQTFSIGGLDYEYKVDADTFTPAGGAVIVIDIHLSTTAQTVAVAAVAAVNAQATSTVTATAPVSGVATFTAKTRGYAGNVAASGNGGGTQATVQFGLDPMATYAMSLAIQNHLNAH